MAVAGCHVMAKPGGAICNIDCTYCFYLEKEALYPERNKNWRMSERRWNNLYASILPRRVATALTLPGRAANRP